MSSEGSFQNQVADAAGKAAVSQASAKFNCKDVNFKEPRTWGWIMGIVCSILLITSGFVALFSAAFVIGLTALICGCALFFIEFFCCFKCCVKCRPFVQKSEKFMSNPFFKGACFIVLGVVGVIVGFVSYADQGLFAIILFFVAIAAGIAYTIFGIKERADSCGGSGGASNENSSVSTKYFLI